MFESILDFVFRNSWLDYYMHYKFYADRHEYYNIEKYTQPLFLEHLFYVSLIAIIVSIVFTTFSTLLYKHFTKNKAPLIFIGKSASSYFFIVFFFWELVFLLPIGLFVLCGFYLYYQDFKVIFRKAQKQLPVFWGILLVYFGIIVSDIF